MAKLKTKTHEIKTMAPFNELFAIDENILNAISENIRLKGFDESQPIVLWEGKDIVIDGHTRLAAAKKAELEQVHTCTKPFADEAAALAYAIHNQRNRRNLTQAEIIRCIEKVDQRLSHGGDRRSEEAQKTKASHDALKKTASKTAAIVGVSQATVERARTALSDPEVGQAVKAGNLSINQGAQTVKAKRKTATEKKKDPHPESDAMHFVTIAISQLSRIRVDDPRRGEALEKVLKWANKQLTGG